MRNFILLIFLLVAWFDLKAETSGPKDIQVKTTDARLEKPHPDAEFGLQLEEHLVDSDNRFLSLRYQMNFDAQDLSDVIGLGGLFTFRLTNWWPVISFEGLSLSETLSNQSLKHSLQVYGLGMGTRGFLVQQMLRSRQWFEFLNAQLTYNQFKNKLDNDTYSGYGLKTQYGLHYLLSKGLHFGLLFTYNWATVTKNNTDTNAGLSRNARTKQIDWMGLGIDLAVHF